MKPTTYRVKKAAAGINIFMVEDVTEIEETVIVGQRRVNKASVTSSNFVVRAEELAETPVANVMSLLQGRVAGLNIQLNNGLPGAQGTMTIRGISDISVVGNKDTGWNLASSAPLFVVDGIPSIRSERLRFAGIGFRFGCQSLFLLFHLRILLIYRF